MDEWLAFFYDGRMVSVGTFADANAAEAFCVQTFRHPPVYWATKATWQQKLNRPLPIGSAPTIAEFL